MPGYRLPEAAGVVESMDVCEPVEVADFRPRSILVTGGAGFIGSAVVRRLLKVHPDYRVTVLDKLDYCATERNLAPVIHHPNFEFVKGDIKSADLVRYVLSASKVDTILHFAAQTHVDNSFGNSLEFTQNNTFGTHVLLEAARKYGKILRFINVSTDEVYGEASFGLDSGLGENSVLQPTNPYSAAKAGAEMMVQAYGTSYNMPIITTRGNNVYGPHQFPEKLIPKFILRAARGNTLPIHGDGLSVRSYVYVEDAADAFMTVLHKGVTGETYNIATQVERTVMSVAHDIANRVKNCDITQGPATSPVLEHVADRAFNDRQDCSFMLRYFICDKKLAALGWTEKTSWEKGLNVTIEWYHKHGHDSYWEHGNVSAALQPHPAAVAV
ncbi:hypothetical protein WJX74_002427 [Apatococcus lobatus]|uniref:NAD(P)-binding domain-containing protein n=1 Tax=Apatococcus lobatus TaxID=904363 RepID=A0AAW1Q814_9CHLO